MNQLPDVLTLFTGPTTDIVLASAGVLLIAMEAGYSCFVRRDGVYRARDVAINVASYIVYQVLFALGLGLFVPAYTLLARVAPWTLPASSPWSLVLAIVVGDFAAYVAHRAAHRLPPLWALHHPHHSAERFNLTVGLRQAWLHGLLQLVYTLPFALVGVPLTCAALAARVLGVWGFLVHTPYVTLPRLLALVLCAPSHHRVHHARNPRYIDKNFGVLLIVWDRLFGTFAEEEQSAPPVYGVDDAPSASGLLEVQLRQAGQVVARWWRHGWTSK